MVISNCLVRTSLQVCWRLTWRLVFVEALVFNKYIQTSSLLFLMWNNTDYFNIQYKTSVSSFVSSLYISKHYFLMS